MNRLALAVSGIMFLGAAAAAGEDLPSPYLPSASGLPGWKAEGTALVFRGEELYDHINGGAEIFMEFGFVAAITQDYADPGGQRLVLEIYEMEDDAAAYGMFTFFRTPGGEAIDLGDAGHLADYYLSLWKGRFFVNITAESAAESAAAALRALAAAVEERLPGGGRVPRLVSLPPAEGRIAEGDAYFEGGLGFLNAVPFFGSDAFGVRKGIKAAYAGGFVAFLLEFESPAESLERVTGAGARWKDGPGFRDVTHDGAPLFRLEKEDGRTALISVVGSHIVGGVIRRPGSGAEAALEAAIEEIRRTLESETAPRDAPPPTGAWRVGFSERARYDTWDNVETLEERRRVGRAAVFFRTRLSLDGPIAGRLEFGLGLAHELRRVIAPAGEAFDWDEVIFDRLFVRWTLPASLPLTLTLGRQRLFFGEGFLVAEGTPLDETRSDYFNAVRLDGTTAGGLRFTFFACHQTEKDSFLPVIRSRSRPLVEQPETGVGLVFGAEGERRAWEGCIIFKKSAAGSVPMPPSDILAFDGRFVWKPLPETAFSAEAAFQTGTRGGARLASWGANARLSWEPKRSLPVPIRVSAEALALSGDDPASETDEGWVPLFSRWPRWSESYIHTLAMENGGRTAWWSNLFSLHGELDVRITERLGLGFSARRLAAPQAASGDWDRISGGGRVRGTLLAAAITFFLSDRLSGRLLYESFRPGSYYVAEADGYSFLRFELLWAF